MSSADGALDLGPDPRSARTTLRTPGTAEVRMQPVPCSAARVPPTGGRGLARERLRLFRTYGARYRQAMAVAGQALSRSPSPRVGLRENRVNALADLAAVHLYLSTEWVWLDEALARGTVGAHLPLARCVASGLSRLVPYRGPAIMRTSVAGSVTDWYRAERLVVDHGFLSASLSATALCEGGPGFLVWSLTGRHTGTIDPYVPGRLVFTPGTRFKVLQLVEGRHPLVLMRELFPQESTPHRPTGGSEGSHTAWLDGSTVAALEKVVGEPRALAVTDILAPQMRAPGLIVTRKGEGGRAVGETRLRGSGP